MFMNMVQSQPLQTTVFFFFLGKLLENERTEKIYDFKAIGVLIKMKLLKRNHSPFSLLKDVFKMAAKRNESIAVYETVAVPCRTALCHLLSSATDIPQCSIVRALETNQNYCHSTTLHPDFYRDMPQ